MKLVMTLVVRDEADILPFQLAYHRAQGVDHFLVLDHRSIDDTPEILAAAARAGWLSYYQERSLLRYQGQWVTTLARKAFTELKADWVINNDADEFWWHDQGSLKATLSQIPASYRLVSARRHNFVCTLPWAQHTETQNKEVFWQAMTWRQKDSVNFLGQPLSSKLCHRGEAQIVVHHGNHSVAPMQPEDVLPDSHFEIFHYPVRHFAQFERKVRNGGASWSANPHVSEHIGKGKRFLYERYLMGKLRPVFERWAYTPERMQQALKEDGLVADLRLKNWAMKHKL